MITDKQIQSALRNVTSETILNDGNDQRGGGSLRLRIRAGAKGPSAVWLAFWRREGKRGSKVIGRYPEMTLAQARQHFRGDVSPTLQAGKVLRVKTEQTAKPTVEAMFKAYVDNMRSKGRESADEVERMLLTCQHSAADDLGRNRLAADVEADDVAEHVARYFRKGRRGAADKARSYISSAFNWAKKSAYDYTVQNRQNWGVKTNPAEAIPRDQEATTTRERNLSAGEIKALWNAADGEGEHFSLETAGCVRLLITCGQRVRETLRIDAEEIDIENALWNMPTGKTKMKIRPHSIPLPSQAVDVLRQLIAAHPSGPLFPARTGAKGELIHSSSVMQAIERWYKATGAEPMQTRDLRRTWKSRTADAGIDRFTRDLIQQHAKNDTGSKNYDRADYLPQMREAMKKWEIWLQNAIA